MALNEKQLKRISDLLEGFDSGAVQPEELVRSLKLVIGIVKQLNAKLEKRIAEHESTVSGELSTAYSDIKNAEARLSSLIESAKKMTHQQFDAELTALRTDVDALWSSLPKDFDATELENRISEVEAKIPTIPEERSIEEIRDALEKLEGDERIDVSAIKGLSERLEKLTKAVGKAGGTSGLPVSNWPRHETFTMNGSDTHVTLQQAVGAAGNAIFAVRYQGQVLDMTTHYTVNGNKIQLVDITPESGDIISVTYMP